MGHLHEFLDAPRRASLGIDPDHCPHTRRAERLIAETERAAGTDTAGAHSTAQLAQECGGHKATIRNLCAELATHDAQVTRGLESFRCTLDGGVEAVLGYRWNRALLKATAVECWVGGWQIAQLLSEDALLELAQQAAECHIDDIRTEPEDPGYDERGQYRQARRSDARADVDVTGASA
jgi:hypothetical protein